MVQVRPCLLPAACLPLCPPIADAWCLRLHACMHSFQVEEGRDYCVITPPAHVTPATIDTYDDHRMAMAFSLAACSGEPITINDPGCTRKTFPTYFQVLDSVAEYEQ